MNNHRRFLLTPPPVIPNGVYIQSVDGDLYTESEWSSSLTPNGIAVVTNNCRFVVSLVYYDDGTYTNDAYISDYPVLQEYTSSSFLPIVASSSVAAYDFDGRSNTYAILTVSNFGSAARTCYNYTFPNGRRGYLGAAGEMYVFYQLRSTIDSRRYKLFQTGQLPSDSGASYPDAWYFSSTRGQDGTDTLGLTYNSFWETGMRNGKADLWQGSSLIYNGQITVPFTYL